MQWYELFNREHKPSEVQVKEFVNSPLFDELDGPLREVYKASYITLSVGYIAYKPHHRHIPAHSCTRIYSAACHCKR